MVKDVVKQEDGSASSTSAEKRPHAGGGGGASVSTSSSGLSNFFSFMDSLKDEEEEEVLYVSVFFRHIQCVARMHVVIVCSLTRSMASLVGRAKSRREKGVKKLQKDINTYTQEPADEDEFKEWKAGFNLEARTVEISQLLSANNKLRAIHNELRTP